MIQHDNIIFYLHNVQSEHETREYLNEIYMYVKIEIQDK